MHAISRTITAIAVAAVTTLALAMAAAASTPTRAAAPPTITSIPTIEGPAYNPFVGDKLTASSGHWTDNPTSYAYHWDRCDALGSRRNCVPIASATSQSYKLGNADADHTLRVRVTATNADGSTTEDSKGTGIVSKRKASPTNKQRPSISGSAVVGSTLTLTDGIWAGAASYTRRWQRCNQDGKRCSAIKDATGKTYDVRGGDAGHKLRAVVTAKNKWGKRRSNSNLTPVVKASEATTTTTPAPTPPPQKGGSCAATSLTPPARMLIDRWSFSPPVVTKATRAFTARIHVSEVTSGCSVSGAQIWTTAIPYNQVGVVQTITGGDGWAKATFTITGGFPANPGRQQILVILVRATRPGGNPLAGVSTVRVLSEKVSLR
ncbi:MAG TPA: hypothetical protein VJ986_13225 [Gaiellaceae bacterium]|nr:hypothetical protein [Gaiellaceae bacterium]